MLRLLLLLVVLTACSASSEAAPNPTPTPKLSAGEAIAIVQDRLAQESWIGNWDCLDYHLQPSREGSSGRSTGQTMAVGL